MCYVPGRREELKGEWRGSEPKRVVFEEVEVVEIWVVRKEVMEVATAWNDR